MRNNQFFVLLLLILMPLSGCITENEDNSEGEEEEGVMIDVEIESIDSVNSVSSESNDELIDVTLLSENEFNITELEFTISYTNDGIDYMAS